MAEPRLFDQSSLRPRLEQAFDFAARQVRLTVERTPDYFPIYTVGGRWLHRGELWTDWCGGVHAGMMWLIANRTGESWWRRTAEHYSGLLEHRQHDHNVHDLGFIFLNTYLPWYQATGDERLQAVLITAGRTLALRYNPRGRFLNSFIGPVCVWGVASGSAASHPVPGSSGMVEISEEPRHKLPLKLFTLLRLCRGYGALSTVCPVVRGVHNFHRGCLGPRAERAGRLCHAWNRCDGLPALP